MFKHSALARSARFLGFLESGELFDVILKVGKNQIPIKAHKQILMISSAYFYSKLKNQSTTDNNNEGKKIEQQREEKNSDQAQNQLNIIEEEVKELNIQQSPRPGKEQEEKITIATASSSNETILIIEDLEPNEIKLFLKFLYSVEFPFNFDIIMELFPPAIKFEEKPLIDYCRNFIKSHLSFTNAIAIFEKAFHCKDTNLVDYSMKFICSEAYIILDQPNFVNIQAKCLAILLKRSDLHVFNELQLFEALIRWGKEECTRRHLNNDNIVEKKMILDPLLRYIRFPQINLSDFSSKVVSQDLLPSHEIVKILQYINNPRLQEPLVTFVGRFNASRRNYTSSLLSNGLTKPHLAGNPRSRPRPRITQRLKNGKCEEQVQ